MPTISESPVHGRRRRWVAAVAVFVLVAGVGAHWRWGGARLAPSGVSYGVPCASPSGGFANIGAGLELSKGSHVDLLSVKALHSANVQVEVGVGLPSANRALGAACGPPGDWVVHPVAGTRVEASADPNTRPYLVVSALPHDDQPWSVDSVQVTYRSGPWTRTVTLPVSVRSVP